MHKISNKYLDLILSEHTHKHHSCTTLPSTIKNLILLLLLDMASAIASTAAASGSTRVAVVTGANKGIGFCIAQQLVASEQFGRVILACRNERLAQEAAGKLGLGASTVTVECAPLDLGDPNSVDAFAAHVRSAAVGRLDVLVNNGAIAFKGSDPTPFRDQTEPTLRVNYFGTARLTDALLPLLRETGENPQVVSVASMAGKLGQIKSAELRGGFASESLTREKLDALVESFAAAVQAGDHQRTDTTHYTLKVIIRPSFKICSPEG